HPREHHEAGRQSEFRDRHLFARYENQDRPDRLRAVGAIADDALQARKLGAFWSPDVRREELVRSRFACRRGKDALAPCPHALSVAQTSVRKRRFAHPAIQPLSRERKKRELIMKITDVRAHHIRIPYDAGPASFRQGASAISALEMILV